MNPSAFNGMLGSFPFLHFIHWEYINLFFISLLGISVWHFMVGLKIVAYLDCFINPSTRTDTLNRALQITRKTLKNEN